MRIPRSYDRTHGGDLLMTPMIDVVFLLLVFFVCTASFQIAEEILPSNLMAAGATAPDVPVDPVPPLERVVIEVHSAGEKLAWTVNERPYASLGQVRDTLAQIAAIDPGLPVILDIEGGVPLGGVIDVYDVCRLVGLGNIQFAASVPP